MAPLTRSPEPFSESQMFQISKLNTGQNRFSSLNGRANWEATAAQAFRAHEKGFRLAKQDLMEERWGVELDFTAPSPR